MKYVMLKLDGGEFPPVALPQIPAALPLAQSVPAAVISVGRVYLQDGKIIAHGASSSPDVLSREEDRGIIQAYLDGQNVTQQEL